MILHERGCFKIPDKLKLVHSFAKAELLLIISSITGMLADSEFNLVYLITFGKSVIENIIYFHPITRLFANEMGKDYSSL